MRSLQFLQASDSKTLDSQQRHGCGTQSHFEGDGGRTKTTTIDGQVGRRRAVAVAADAARVGAAAAARRPLSVDTLPRLRCVARCYPLAAGVACRRIRQRFRRMLTAICNRTDRTYTE